MSGKTVERPSKPSATLIELGLAEGLSYGVLTELVGYSLRRAQIRIYQDFLNVLEPWSITPPRFSAMVLVRHNAGMKLTELARGMGIARSGAVEVVNSLEKLGYVRRCDSPTDRRAFALELTASGRKVLDQATKLVCEHDARISARLSQEEHIQLRTLLDKLG